MSDEGVLTRSVREESQNFPKMTSKALRRRYLSPLLSDVLLQSDTSSSALCLNLGDAKGRRSTHA